MVIPLYIQMHLSLQIPSSIIYLPMQENQTVLSKIYNYNTLHYTENLIHE